MCICIHLDINSTNITDITIPAVLLSKVRTVNSTSSYIHIMHCFNVQSLGAMLVNYSSPTDAEPIGSVIVRVHYADDYAIPMLIVVGCGGLLILTMIICLVSAHVCTYVPIITIANQLNIYS